MTKGTTKLKKNKHPTWILYQLQKSPTFLMDNDTTKERVTNQLLL